MALRCLIVDDSLQFVEVASALLAQEGIAVVGRASTGAEAVELVVELRPDVVLLDVDLSGESGFAVARRLQRETHLVASSVILISTYAEEDFADLVTTAPVAGFVSKSRLSARAIHAVLDRTGNGTTA